MERKWGEVDGNGNVHGNFAALGLAWAGAQDHNQPQGWQHRQRRRVAAVIVVALGLAAFIVLLGTIVHGSQALIAAGRSAPLTLLQQLDAYDGDDDGSRNSIRDDILATAPSSRTQSLSWLDWNEEDIEAKEAYIKKTLITIEQGLIAQPQRLTEMKVALGHVYEYYGKNGKLQQGVPQSLTSVRAQMQKAEDTIMNSEKMHKLTSDVRAIREGAKMFLQTQHSQDTTQDQLLDWTKGAQKTFQGNTYEHFKTLKRHLRGDERDVGQYSADVESMVGDNRRTITHGVHRKKEELEAKGKQLTVKFFGEGGKHMRGKTRGRKRNDGLWDAVEEEANANVTKGLAHMFSKWDSTAWTSEGGLDRIEGVLAKLLPDMRTWQDKVTWRLGNMSESIDNFKSMNANITFPLSAAGKEQWKAIAELQDAIDDMAEKRAVALDPCIGVRETAQALSAVLAILTERQQTARFDDVEGQKKLEGVREAFYNLGSRQLNDAHRKKMFKVILGTATQQHSTATVVEADTDTQYELVSVMPVQMLVSSLPFRPASPRADSWRCVNVLCNPCCLPASQPSLLNLKFDQ